MSFIQFAPNLYIANDPSFGNYDRDIIHTLLASVDVNFSVYLEIPPFISRDCYIIYNPACPMCTDISIGHQIHLNTQENYWCQWIYQFAHEYCHHLINGKFTGEITGLTWFEESICELASMFQLSLFCSSWSQSHEEYQTHYAPSLRDYLDALLSKNLRLLSSASHPGWLQSWDSILSEPAYHRDYYNVIATKMFPLFVEHPYLWKIILHLGDTRQWKTLDELFAHLHSQADDSYTLPLQKLHDLLLS